MRKTLLTLMTICLFMSGFAALGMAASISIADLVKLEKLEPEGGFDYGTENEGAGLGEYLGTGTWDNYGDPTALEFFYASGFDHVESLEIVSTPADGGQAGSWYVVQNAAPNTNYVEMLVIKSAKNFSVHQYTPSALSGIWDVGYLRPPNGKEKTPDMSFVRAFQVTSNTPDIPHVPEPGTMLLLGFGLAGLAFVRRKFSN